MDYETNRIITQEELNKMGEELSNYAESLINQQFKKISNDMDYEKKYKELHTFISDLYPFMSEYCKEKVEGFLPELCESEDEKIRKGLINGFNECLKNSQYSNNAQKYWHNIKIEDIFAWLEKQGREKPADKVGTKFKVGDWVVQGYNILKIKCVGDTHYCFETVGGYVDDMLVSEIDSQFHLWTIQDAKDGDVLIDKSGSRECPFIFKETKPSDIKTDILNPLAVLGYCGIGGAGFTKGSGWGDTANCIYYPATKEQRDLLFQKIKEVGYEWDAEKKELEKQGEQRAAWSEEDETKLKSACALIKNTSLNGNEGIVDSIIDWLKSLKQRYTWKPSDEQIGVIEAVINNRSFQRRHLDSLYEQLKKLKE